VLGLPPTHRIDRQLLERVYLERSASVHPDRFTGAAAAEQRQAMERASALNQAYRTLRDPVLRAEYLVKLGGIDLDSSDPHEGAPNPGQAFLLDMIARREQLDEARQAGTAALEHMRDQVEQEAHRAFERALEALEACETQRAAHQLVARRYLQRLLEEIDDTQVES